MRGNQHSGGSGPRETPCIGLLQVLAWPLVDCELGGGFRWPGMSATQMAISAAGAGAGVRR